MARPPVSSLDAGELSEALAVFLASAPSPWKDTRPFHDWCHARAKLKLETEKDWLASEIRHLLGIERDADHDLEDHSGPNMWLRHLRTMRAVHCEGKISKWLAVLTVALLKDPARSALVDAMERWVPDTPARQALPPARRLPRTAA